jgi:hypothetical protein
MAQSKKNNDAPTGHGDTSPRLLELDRIPEGVRDTLAAHDITHVDQLTSVAGISSAREALRSELGISEEELHAVVDAARTRSSGTAAAAPGPARSLGAMRPPASDLAKARSLPFASTRAGIPKLPPKVNFVSKMSPIRDQGNRGTCVAFCLTAIHEYATHPKPDFSERHLYYLAKHIDGEPSQCGTHQSAASRALRTSGQCVEAIWAYNASAACNAHGTPPHNAATDATQHTISLSAVNPHDIVGIKSALAQGRPVGISVPVYNSWYQSPTTDRTGRITMPFPGEQDVGGHCMCIVGYQDDTASTITETPGGGYFILRNSWSTHWGRQCQYGAGYGTIPYAYIAAYNWESYTLPQAAPKKKTKASGGTKKRAAKRVAKAAKRKAARKSRR